MREVSALPRHTPTEPKKDISTLLKHGLIILVTTHAVGLIRKLIAQSMTRILTQFAPLFLKAL